MLTYNIEPLLINGSCSSYTSDVMKAGNKVITGTIHELSASTSIDR